MIAAVEPASPYADQIIPPDLWPTAHDAAAMAGSKFSAAGKASEATASGYRVAAEQLSETTEGATSEALVRTHVEIAIDHGNHADIREVIAQLFANQIAQLAHDLTACLRSIEYQAHQEISASSPAEREKIVETARARAAVAHAEFTAVVGERHTQAAGKVEPYVVAIGGRIAPTAPPPIPAPTDTPDLEPSGPAQRGPKTLGQSDDTLQSEPGGPAQRGRKAPAQRDGSSQFAPDGPALRGEKVEDGSVPLPVGLPGAGAGSTGGGGSGWPSGLTGSSMPSGAGGLAALGSDGGLSGLMSRVGQAPTVQGGGLKGGGPAGMPGSQFAAAATGLSQGISAGSNVGSPLQLPPATGTGTPAATASSTAPTPTVGLSQSGASPGMAASGAHGPPAGSGPLTAETAVATPAPITLPSPGMGAPGASVTGGATPFAPAGAPGSAAGSGASTGATAASTSGLSGPVVVPASVVSAGAGAGQRGGLESAELAAAKALALKLRNDCDYSNYAFIQWAVGVFRSEAGGSTECLVMSNEGFGYIPWGVFLPRSARILASDTLADNEFRERWYACHDPAEVLVEYAKLRVRRGSHLVALAATADSPAGRAPGIEYAVVPPRKMGDQYSKPVLDDLHAHRLQALHPDLYAKLQRLTATDTHARLVENNVVVVLAMQMIDAVQTSGVEMPLELRQMWNALGTGDEISEDAWEQYKIASGVYFVNVSANRPKPGAGVTDRERYHGQWVAARAMELLGGWEKLPTAVEDMVYAAAAAYPGDFASKFEFLLRAAEAEMGR